jgi:DNA mismatch repair protein MutL
VVEALALSRPDVGYFLRSDGRRSLALPAAADLREHIAQVHGLSLARSLIALEDPVIWGFVSPLAVSFPTRRYLHGAVNGRVVEADSFAPAVAKAYADLLPKGRHPAAFLRLELGPGEVDVNVHPAKSAVRLRGGRSAYPLVVVTIRVALAQERETGGAPSPEEGSRELTLIGQFAGRCIVFLDRTELRVYGVLRSSAKGASPKCSRPRRIPRRGVRCQVVFTL